MKRRKLRPLSPFRFGRWHPVRRYVEKLTRFLVKSQILTIFFGLTLLGVIVGLQTRPARGTFPYAELFDQMRVVSYRESPADTAARFVVQLGAGGKIFSQYDVDARTFLPPPQGRSYARTITGTHYAPLRVRGHVGNGFWIDAIASRRTLLPEQFEELYRTTLNFVNPVGKVTGVLGILSGYSVGYRLGVWNSSLASRKVQERVLATQDLGRLVAREAWRRVLLEPVIMSGEDDASRFAALASTQRLYANFFRVALDDSNGFIPREAERLEKLGHAQEARAMRAFAAAVQHAAGDSVPLTSADFEAVERWATLLDRRGHWVTGAIPAPGEERIKLLGTLAWYGLAPPGQNVDRVWVGPRMLVRVGESEGFVADEIPATGVGCPIAWRARLTETHNGAGAMASAWLADRPEFTALMVVGQRVAKGVGRVSQQIAEWRSRDRQQPLPPPARPAPPPKPAYDAAFAARQPVIVSEVADGSKRLSFAYPLGENASLNLLAADSASAVAAARAAQAAVAAPPPAADSATGAVEVAHPLAHTVDAMADSLRAHGTKDALIQLPGSASALGTSPTGDAWSVVLRDPRARIPGIARLRLGAGQALSVVGNADRGSNAAVGANPGAGLIGVAVLAPDATTAAEWSATLLATSPTEAKTKAKSRPDILAILIEAGSHGQDLIWVEDDLTGRFSLDVHARTLFRVEVY